MSGYSDWYAIRVKANRERVTADALRGKGLEVCLPVYQAESRRSRGSQILHIPLFTGYVFSRFDLRTRLPVLTIPGVVNIVGFGNDPTPVDPAEMSAVLALVNSDLQLMSHPYLPVGQRVCIQEGPLRGVEGVIVSHGQTNQLVVSVTLFQRSMAVDLERHWLSPVTASFAKSA